MKETENNLRNGTLLQGGKYRIVKFISSGGFGCTYEAIHTVFNERMAIKEFFYSDYCNRDAGTSHVTVGVESKKTLVEKFIRKFVDETKVLYKMNHEGIVRVTDVFEENGTAYYVMDYIDGLSLKQMVERKGKMSEARALRYIRQVCEALRYVHSQNRLHLDIKPANIMVDDKDEAVLIDFGTSKQYNDESGENKSTLMGVSHGYAPLEQEYKDVTRFLPATDIYALGATLYFLLTGVKPPTAGLLAGGDEALQPLPKSVSTATKQAIYAAMQTAKSGRPQSIDAFLKILNGDDTVGDDTVLGGKKGGNSDAEGGEEGACPRPGSERTQFKKYHIARRRGRSLRPRCLFHHR